MEILDETIKTIDIADWKDAIEKEKQRISTVRTEVKLEQTDITEKKERGKGLINYPKTMYIRGS